MTIRIIGFLLNISLCCGVYAQTLDQEKNNLAKLQQQQQQLQTLNQELTSTISQLEKQIELSQNSSGEFSDALEKAENTVKETQSQYDTEPTLINQSRLENAQFRYAIALRRYEKGNPELAKLIQERDELARAKKTNELNLQSKTDEANAQKIIIERLETSMRERAKTLATQAEKTGNLSVKSPENLKSSEAEHQAALEEVKRLRAEFAAQKQAYLDKANRNLAIENANAKSSDQILQNYAVVDDLAQSQQLDSKFNSFAAEVALDETKILDKFLTLKLFENGNLSLRQTIKLDHIGNNIFKAVVTPNKAEVTTLVVGSEEWTGTLASTAESLVTLFDLRDPAQTKLVVYQQVE